MTCGRRPGLWFRAALLAALAFFATACDSAPEPKGVLGVERAADGGVRLLLGGCPGYMADGFSVLADTEGGALVAWSVHNDGWTSSVQDVGVFQAPPEGWQTTNDSLTALRDGVPYVATVSGSVNSRGVRGRVPFTASDLAGLGSGQVLAWAGGEETLKISRDVFLRADPDRCRP